VRGEAPAIVAGGATVSYAVLEEKVRVATGRLRALGIVEGSRVGLWAENCVEWVTIALAVPRAGAVLVPLNARLADPEVAWQMARAGLRLAIAGDALAARRPGGPRVVSFDEWNAVAPSNGDPAPGADDPSRDHAILFTSGTTGRPKGAVLTRANQLASARAIASALGFTGGDRWLASLPFFHVGGLGIIHRCALAGACVVIPDSFGAEDMDRAIETQQVTHASLVDATLRRILALRGERALPDTLRAVVVGGGPVSAGLLEACPRALASYGLTESCAMATLVRPGSSREQRRSAGPALPGIELRISADGVIEIRGPTVMRGYLDDAAATSAALREGWLHTGDLGEIGADGSLRVLSRREDLIISGGENVYPAEIAAALGEHPQVMDAVVIGVPDERWGEVPLAVVVSTGGKIAGLRAYLEERLARYKLPRIAYADEIPRLANGKPDRVAVRSRFGGGR
jgi:O-succinylbenzoic acid--CoA ligase